MSDQLPTTSTPTSGSTASDPNPFRAPSARVADREDQVAGPLLNEPRRVGAGKASEWIGVGWRMFREAPGPWIGMFVVYVLILAGVGFVPVLGVLGNLLTPILGAGIMLACEAQSRGETPQIGMLFEGFKRNTGSLAMIGVLFLVFVMVVGLVLGVGAIGLFAGVAAAGGESAVTPLTVVVIALLGLAAIVLMMPVSLAVVWAPALVAIHDLAPFPALQMGFSAAFRNWLPLIVFGLLTIVLMLVVGLTLGLAFFVVGPMLLIAMWAAYRDLFRR